MNRIRTFMGTHIIDQVGLYILQLTFIIDIGAVLSLRLSLATLTLIIVDIISSAINNIKQGQMSPD